MKTIFVPCCLMLLGCNVAAEEDAIKPARFTASGHTQDSLSTVKKRLKDKKAVLLDVREQDEWDAGHLKLAKLVPLSKIRADALTAEQKKNLPKDKPIYCHCRSGGRVLTVTKILRAKGYDVRPLKAGYATLIKEGFEKAPPKK